MSTNSSDIAVALYDTLDTHAKKIAELVGTFVRKTEER
jgi:hypothetical protein